MTMKAITYSRYGSPDNLALREIDTPEVADDGVLVRVRAASANPLDWHALRGEPYLVRLGGGLRRPETDRLGVDVAGHVEAVGKDVTELRPGDEVFGGRTGAFAEYVVGVEKNFVPKPAGISFEYAAAIPIAGCTALQALRDHGHVQPGQSVLVNGAAGGVGTFAVQLAKVFGAEVTGVCSTGNVELVRSLGADQVVDYTRADFTRNGRPYDLIVDAVGNRSLRALRRALEPKGTLVIVGGKKGRFLAPLILPLKAAVVNRFVDQQLGWFIANLAKQDLAYLGELVEARKITPAVDRTYPLTETAEAIRHLETGHARGKTVITVGTASDSG